MPNFFRTSIDAIVTYVNSSLYNIRFYFYLFIFLGEISYIATLVNPRWNKGDVMWRDVMVLTILTTYHYPIVVTSSAVSGEPLSDRSYLSLFRSDACLMSLAPVIIFLSDVHFRISTSQLNVQVIDNQTFCVWKRIF